MKVIKKLKKMKQKENTVEWLIDRLNSVTPTIETIKEWCEQARLMEENKILYDFRKAYNVALFNEWGKYSTGKFNAETGQIDMATKKYDVHKSWRHNDGELCFGGGWFIVVAVLPGGQISNHYKAEDWDLFKIPSVERAKYEFDGHTSQDVIQRLLNT